MSTTFTDPILQIEVDRADLISLKESGHVFNFNLISLFDWIIMSGYINPITNLRFSTKSINQINKMLFLRKMIPLLCKSKSNYKIDIFIKGVPKFNTIIKFYEDKIGELHQKIKTIFEEINEKNFCKNRKNIFKLNTTFMLFSGIKDGIIERYHNGNELMSIINNFKGMHKNVLLELYNGNTNPIIA
jgi:hypothetical protein